MFQNPSAKGFDFFIKFKTNFMKISKYFLFLTIFLFTPAIYSQQNYPATKTADSTETYFGETIIDEYQWLENLDNNEVKDWFKEQADYCDNALNKIPNKNQILDELKELDNVKEVYYGSITEVNGKYFFRKRFKGEEISKLYYRDGISGNDILMFDPMAYEPGKDYTLGEWSVSDNGKRVLIDITEKGKEMSFIRIIDVETKNLYPDEIKAASAYSWLDGSDEIFMYQKYQSEDIHKMESSLDSKVFLHTFGRPEAEDREILSRTHTPELNFAPEDYPYISTFKNGNYIFAGKGSVDRNQELYYAPKSQLTSGKIDWKPFCTKQDEIYSFAGYKDNVYLLTPKGASNFKILKVTLPDPKIENAELVFSGNDMKIEEIDLTKDYLVIKQMQNGIETYMSKINLNTNKTEKIEMPLKGSISFVAYSPYSNQCVVYNSDWTIPSNIYSINLDDNTFEKGPFNISFKYPDIENIVAEEVEVASHDGVLVPLTIIYDKSKVNKDGSSICYLNGYGAYGISLNPGFSITRLPLLSRGVVFAIAHVRGGGEKGNDWYRAGWKTTKPNTWKDFIACAEYLIDNGYTSKEKLAGSGGSAGGILIGRAITERPDLFKAAIPMVGCMNALRLEFSPNGPGNIPEFGTVSIEEEYRALKEMDAYQHLEKGEKYPATLITTGFNDPRVISWNPAKFAAKMQNVNSSSNPILLKVDYSTGHFGGETMTDKFKNYSDIYSFILWQCGHPDFQQKPN